MVYFCFGLSNLKQLISYKRNFFFINKNNLNKYNIIPMLNFLVETKNEYTTHLINILTPLIFEGLLSIYKEAQDIAGPDNVLKIFQTFLKRIPKWNQTIIEKETNRIINSSHSYGWLGDLIKATLKSNLVVLMYNPTVKTQTKLDNSFYQNINVNDFIHKVYIECAREIWNNPYLLYHNYPPIEIKRNQRDCMCIIKDCIKEAIRKLLPVKHILQIYLGEDIELNNDNDNFERAMSEAEEKNLTKLIQKDLANDKVLEINYSGSDAKETKSKATIETPKPDNGNNSIGEQIATNVNKTSDEKTIGSRILNIINQNSLDTSDVASLLSSDKADTAKSGSNSSKKPQSSTSDSESMGDLKQSIRNLEESLKPNKNTNGKNPESIDDKIKKILQKDLATDSDLETSLNYSQEDNDNKYQEIFSNSNVQAKSGQAKPDVKNLKDKKKFFNNYMQF
jgi:hypothetical protein